MRAFFIGLMFLVLTGCSNHEKEIPEVAFKGTQVEDLVDKPDRELMMKLGPKKRLEYGMDDASAATVISDNNLRAATAERRLEGAQQYICNLFKEPVGEVCKKSERSN